MKTCKVFFCILVSLCIFGSLAAQDSTFVEIPGINGESTDPAHVNWIDAYAIDQDQSFPITSALVPTGVTTFSPVAILKGTDTSSVQLFQASSQQTVLATVTIEVCRDNGGSQECYYRLTLTNARVRSVALAGSACVDPSTSCTPTQTESVEFTYQKIDWSYIPWSGGSPGASIDFCWDVSANAPC